MRAAVVLAAMVLVLSGLLVGVRLVTRAPGNEVSRVERPATAGVEAPKVAGKAKPAEPAEPAMADIFFERPVRVEEALKVVGGRNRENITTMEGAYRVGGDEITDMFSVPPGLKTAREMERAWVEARTGSLVDMSSGPQGPVLREPGTPEGAPGGPDGGLREQRREMRDAIGEPRTREILVTRVSLEGSSAELERLPAGRSDAVGNVSVTTEGDLMEHIERLEREAERRGDPPPDFD